MQRRRSIIEALITGLLCAFVAVCALNASPVSARIQPYYVISGTSFGQVKPRVLFVVDTSDSMGVAATEDFGMDGIPWRCKWSGCEEPGDPEESRMSVARRAMHAVVDAYGKSAEFSLATFWSEPPPTAVPPKCDYIDPITGLTEQRRFIWMIEEALWVMWRDHPLNGDPADNYMHNNCFKPIDEYSSIQGVWGVCAGKWDWWPGFRERAIVYPWAYLRWDDLGILDPSKAPAVSANNMTGALPDSPLLNDNATDLKSKQNAMRQVQWFPRFMGQRVNLNDTTDPTREVLYGTVGDYGINDGGSGTADLDANVWGQDFYYWPYVDGFVGYTYSGHVPEAAANPGDPGYQGLPLCINGGILPSTHPDYPWQDQTARCWRYGSGPGGRAILAARLFTPFVLTDEERVNLANPANEGPSDVQETLTEVLAYSSPTIAGGLDASTNGNTPWGSAIGDIPAVTTMDNRRGSHPTIASYLKFLREVGVDNLCTPLTLILLGDGQASGGPIEAGFPMYQRIAALRNSLNVKVYVVGIFVEIDEINNMACAGTGACDGDCATPCDDPSPNNFDTCQDPTDPLNACSYIAQSGQDIERILARIIKREIDLELDSGPGTVMADFGIGTGDPDTGESYQSSVNASTDWPGWKGHVTRARCDQEVDDGMGGTMPAPFCQLPSVPPDPGSPVHPSSSCPPDWEWDAGECLQALGWQSRNLYTHDTNNNLIRIYDSANGGATPEFKALVTMAPIGPGGATILPNTEPDATNLSNAFAEFLQGKDWPDGWVLPGLANSAPVVVRKVPKPTPGVVPQVAIRDPHCGGRTLSSTAPGRLPQSLVQFASDAWDPSNLVGPPPGHSEYQNAVLVGDDLGFVHAFQMETGDELFALMPRFLLASAKRQFDEGAAVAGQPEKLEEHIYGVSATVNQSWVYDDVDNKWRHLAVVGLGGGGNEYIALDVSHMSPYASKVGRPSCSLLTAGCPVEVLWTTEDAALKSNYDAINAETWARPALGFTLTDHVLGATPKAHLIFGGGYTTSNLIQGRSLIRANAITGAIEEVATTTLPAPEAANNAWDPATGMGVDPSVASHCMSRFWPEMQEVYVFDGTGRLYRWDQGHPDKPNSVRADSGGPWFADGANTGPASPVARLYSCVGPGQLCTVDLGGRGEAFAFAPAVTSYDRIDQIGAATQPASPQNPEQFLLAAVSGSTYDDKIDGGDPDNHFHSSLYLLVDDHESDPAGGFSIPSSQDLMDNGGNGIQWWDPSTFVVDDPHYLRIALSQLVRVRDRTFPDGTSLTDVARFSKAARPIRSPRIQVRSIRKDNGDGTSSLVAGVEAFDIEFMVYEPSLVKCDPRFYDAVNDVWYYDEGSVYKVKFRLTASSESGFNFQTGASNFDFGTGGPSPGLTYIGAEQLKEGDCADGICSPRAGTPERTPCVVDEASEIAKTATRVIGFSQNNVSGFAPVE